jgi:hypothetical protein
MYRGEKPATYHNITVNWHIELFYSQPVIFQCVPNVMSHLYFYGQKEQEAMSTNNHCPVCLNIVHSMY